MQLGEYVLTDCQRAGPVLGSMFNELDASLLRGKMQKERRIEFKFMQRA